MPELTRADRLPRWAKEEMARLRMRLEEETTRADRAEAIQADPELTNTVVNVWGDGERGLPVDSSIRFYPGDKTEKSRRGNYIDVSVRDGGIHVLASQPLLISVASSNVVGIRNSR